MAQHAISRIDLAVTSEIATLEKVVPGEQSRVTVGTGPNPTVAVALEKRHEAVLRGRGTGRFVRLFLGALIWKTAEGEVLYVERTLGLLRDHQRAITHGEPVPIERRFAPGRYGAASCDSCSRLAGMRLA